MNKNKKEENVDEFYESYSKSSKEAWQLMLNIINREQNKKEKQKIAINNT